MPKEKEEAGERPSPDERRRGKVAKQLLSKIDKNYRTRKAKKIKENIKQLQDEDPEILERLLREAERAKPPKKVGSERIYSGKSRSFTKDFMKDYWDAISLPADCSICKGKIQANGKGSDAPSIDHVRPWATIKTEIEPITVCKDGVHWKVVLAKTMREVFQDTKNLKPAHQGCNSGKSGPKDTDSIAPERAGNCPGENICTERKAT